MGQHTLASESDGPSGLKPGTPADAMPAPGAKPVCGSPSSVNNSDSRGDSFTSSEGGQWTQPNGPKPQTLAAEDMEQGVVGVEPSSTGGLQLRITLLAAGFVIGPAGASIRDVCRVTGAEVRSWTLPGDDVCPRPTRTFRVEGLPGGVALAATILCDAVERYKELCEGAYAGQSVPRIQCIQGVDFCYQPPPRAQVPQAAMLKGTSGRRGRDRRGGGNNGGNGNGGGLAHAHVPNTHGPSHAFGPFAGGAQRQFPAAPPCDSPMTLTAAVAALQVADDGAVAVALLRHQQQQLAALSSLLAPNPPAALAALNGGAFGVGPGHDGTLGVAPGHDGAAVLQRALAALQLQNGGGAPLGLGLHGAAASVPMTLDLLSQLQAFSGTPSLNAVPVPPRTLDLSRFGSGNSTELGPVPGACGSPLMGNSATLVSPPAALPASLDGTADLWSGAGLYF